MKKTKIFAFEGIDGSGKGVQLKEAHNRLKEKGYRVGLMDFPVYESFFGKEIGNLLSGKQEARADKLDVKSMSLWYAMDRFLAFKDFKLSDYDIVLLNRSTLANAVYQGTRVNSLDEANKLIAWIHELEYDILDIPKPDAFFVFDVTTSTSKKNVSLKGHRDYVGDESDVYEKDQTFLADVRESYLNAVKQFDNVYLIDCMEDGNMRSIPDIANEIEKNIISLMLPYESNTKTQ